MLKNRTGKIILGGIIIIALLPFLFVFNLNSRKKPEMVFPMELIDVAYDSCFSPNGDGIKDKMNLSAHFKGKPNKKVYAFLFIKTNAQFIRLLIGSAPFSQSGEATISLTWDGENWKKQLVSDGTYQLRLYYFNFPSLFNMHKHGADRAFKKVLKQLEKTHKHRIIKKWQGEVVVDTVAPQLMITTPEDNIETTETVIETTGTVEGEDKLTINNEEIPLENNEFSFTLNLEPGENTFTYILEDCAGNRDTQTRTITRIVDQAPPVITINSPEDGTGYKDLPIHVSASYEDSGSGINQNTVKVSLNGSDITSGLTISDSGVSGEISNEELLKDGTNTLVVEVSDNAGNPGSASVYFDYEKIQEEDQTIIYGRGFEAGTQSPLSGAIITSSGKESQTNSEGYWSLVFGTGGTYKIKITKDGYTDVFRKIYLETGKEGVVDDAYLTLKDTKTTPIGPDGGTHSNSDGSVEVIIPQGALNEVKDIQTTRLSSSKALPGDLNETDNLEYPISFLFCADFGPDDITFNTPVTIRVQNTWGFEPEF
ncbi:MAG: hypothetical protein KAS65_02730, partial [Candidatus Aminicenantes bacterium]|nr:hypothetical protein [Candidatus Aminicenantes bacterium]